MISDSLGGALRVASQYGKPDGRDVRMQIIHDAWKTSVGDEMFVKVSHAESVYNTMLGMGYGGGVWGDRRKGAAEVFRKVKGGVPFEAFARICEDPGYTAAQYTTHRGDEAWVTVGNTVRPGGDDNMFEWTVYVRTQKTFVKSVVFHLHKTFEPSEVEVSKAPFELTRCGWGACEVRVEVHLINSVIVNFTHMLTLDRWSEQTMVVCVGDAASMSVLPAHAQWLTQGGSGDLIRKPATSTAMGSLPLHTIDWRKPFPDRATDLISALKRDGFVYIANHGVKRDLMDDVIASSEDFFTKLREDVARMITATQREQFNNPPMKCARGYTPNQAEQLNPFLEGDLKESYDHGSASEDFNEMQLGLNRWPDERRFPGFRQLCEEYLYQVRGLAEDVLRCIAVGLGVEEQILMEAFDRPLVINRLLKYAPQQGGVDAMGAGSHVDYGALTLIAQKSDGLEVLCGTEWKEIPTVPYTFVVNTGYVLEKLTNGTLPAVKHRVINKGVAPRYSTATFYDPNPRTFVSPLAPFITPCSEAKYSPCVAGHKGVVVSVKAQPQPMYGRRVENNPSRFMQQHPHMQHRKMQQPQQMQQMMPQQYY